MVPFRFRQLNRRHLIVLFGILILCVVVGLTRVDYGCDWTGFGACATTAQVNQTVRHEKTLWDWLELLIVPIVLAVGGYIFNRVEKRNEFRRAERRDQTERELAADDQQEQALQTYLDKMSDLLLSKNLRTSGVGDEVRAVARARTLTILRRLDTERKASLLLFLYEANLICKEEPIVDLRGADFIDVNLAGTDLRNICLREVNLAGATLESAFLAGADLRSAKLSRVNLTRANLTEALMHGVRAAEAKLANATISKARLSGANFHNACLSRANLSNALLNNTYLVNADLSYADLSNANLGSANLTSANLNRADLAGAVLFGASLSAANLKAADLRKTDLEYVDLEGTNLSEAHLMPNLSHS